MVLDITLQCYSENKVQFEFQLEVVVYKFIGNINSEWALFILLRAYEENKISERRVWEVQNWNCNQMGGGGDV